MVQVENLGPLLAQHPFFADMDPDALAIVVGCCANHVFKPGTFLYRQNTAADRFFLIRSGMVSLEFFVPGRESVALETIEAGEIIGWSWLVPPYQWSNDARALETVRAISVDGACLRRKIENDRVLGYEIYKRFVPIMARRLMSDRLRILELATEPGGFDE